MKTLLNLALLLTTLFLSACIKKNDPAPNNANPAEKDWGYIVIDGARINFTDGLVQASSSPYYIAAHNYRTNTTPRFQVTAFFNARPAKGQFDCVFSAAPAPNQAYLAFTNGTTGGLRYASVGTKATVDEANGKLIITYSGQGADAGGTGSVAVSEMQILEH